MFDDKISEGPNKTLSLRKFLYAMFGGSSMMSKRLSPPMTIHNARIFADNVLVHKGDICLWVERRKLETVADLYQIFLEVKNENDMKTIWSSDKPEMYQGYCMVNGKECREGALIVEAYPWFEQIAKERQRRWMVDYGLVRRTPKEWVQDFYLWKVMPLKWRFQKLKQKTICFFKKN